jgi:hypothetical protein
VRSVKNDHAVPDTRYLPAAPIPAHPRAHDNNRTSTHVRGATSGHGEVTIELSAWMEAAKIGDIVGITMYRNSWKPGLSTFGINPYAFLDPAIYAGKAAVIQKMFGKEVICIELQAEPWASKPLAEASLADQAKSMNPDMFLENIQFAKQSGLKGFYFWGVEWWYFMKTKHNQPEIWNEAKALFAE